MPAYRTKIRCAYACADSDLDLFPTEKKPRAPKKILTPEEKEEAKAKRAANQVLRAKKAEWTAELKPWTGDERMRWPIDTLALFKSDAKTAFKLTETEILTLPHEMIANSFKSYYMLADVQGLARRKFLAGAAFADLSTDPSVLEDAYVRKKYMDNGRRNKGNWRNAFPWEVPGSKTEIRYTKAKAEKKDEKDKKA